MSVLLNVKGASRLEFTLDELVDMTASGDQSLFPQLGKAQLLFPLSSFFVPTFVVSNIFLLKQCEHLQKS